MSVNKYYVRPVIPEEREDPESRIVIDNIPSGVTEMMLKKRLASHGDARIHVFIPGCQYAKGWAWVSFEQKSATKQLVQNSHSNLGESVEIEMMNERRLKEEKNKEGINETNENELKEKMVNISITAEKETETIVVKNVIKTNNEKNIKDNGFEPEENELSTIYNTEDSNHDEEASSSDYNHYSSLQESGDENIPRNNANKQKTNIEKNKNKSKSVEISLKEKTEKTSADHQFTQDNYNESSADESFDEDSGATSDD